MNDVPCGVRDPKATILEPVHWGCKGCREAVVNILQGRKAIEPSPQRVVR